MRPASEATALRRLTHSMVLFPSTQEQVWRWAEQVWRTNDSYAESVRHVVGYFPTEPSIKATRKSSEIDSDAETKSMSTS